MEFKNDRLFKAVKDYRKSFNKRAGKNLNINDLISAFGAIGWTVITPIMAGVFLGKYIDERWPSRFSFTLMFLFAGAVIGTYNAWLWLKKKMGERNGNKY